MEQIAHNIFVETENFGSNNTMIITPKGIVLVDAPYKPTDAVNWQREVEARGKAIYLIHTDHHPDHTSGNFFLGGEIISHVGTREQLAKEPANTELLSFFDPPGIPLLNGYARRLPTITINDRITLYLGGVTLEIFHLKGHTSNNIMVYIPEQKILITGDNVNNGGLPSFEDQCIVEQRKTLEIIKGMDIEIIVPGHGDVGTKKMVEEYSRLNEEVIGQVEQMIKKGIPKDEIVNTVRYEDKFHASTERYQGYPDHLIEQFQINSVISIYNQLIAMAEIDRETISAIR